MNATVSDGKCSTKHAKACFNVKDFDLASSSEVF